MFSKKQILSAMAGIAMLALPVSAFAGHHDHDGEWNRPRPFAPHDQGWHRGWDNHQRNRGGWYGTPAQRPFVNNAYGWNRYGHRWQPPVMPYSAYGPGYGGHMRPTQAYAGAPNCNAAAAYGSTPATSQSWMMTKRYNTMNTIAQLRARGDSRAAGRLVPTVTALNQRIGGLNNQFGCNGGYGYAPSSYSGPASYGAMPYNGYGYNGSYANNQTVNTLSTIAVPMLSGIR
ncbi:MAG: hypothetical protein ACLQBA_20825 [Candidatus Binataceae bacterium]